jgi:hypothetical protein
MGGGTTMRARAVVLAVAIILAPLFDVRAGGPGRMTTGGVSKMAAVAPGSASARWLP